MKPSKRCYREVLFLSAKQLNDGDAAGKISKLFLVEKSTYAGKVWIVTFQCIPTITSTKVVMNEAQLQLRCKTFLSKELLKGNY